MICLLYERVASRLLTLTIRFPICAKGLSCLMSKVEKDGKITGFSCNYGLRISHLFFADDSVMFCKASVEECHALLDVLSIYEHASEQSVNLAKSSFTFSPNVDHDTKDAIKQLTGLEDCSEMAKYLGLPSMVGRKKIIFQDIKDRVWKRLQVWKGK
ncbi:uncharacterized protein LOC133800253 [Humulus lupulus]|uniref:uncharacterized protein LOC133800253 n=1 Tax=Humulus lupulus TaxID=3486 RepID=UPI002B406EE2|nr:uncharacterized protein LOC133800253 [Humulus lupulus]